MKTLKTGNIPIIVLGVYLLLTSCVHTPDHAVVPDKEVVQRNVLLPPGPGNPRNSEGDFIRLTDGRLMLIYTHFTGGGGDHDSAYLAARFSGDNGRTWTEKDEMVIPNEADMNIMSVSLLRLQTGNIGLFYLQKNSLKDCQPVMRVSRDEGITWSDPHRIIPENQPGYYVLNNDRVVQLSNGRLIAPVARHNSPDWPGRSAFGHIMCYVSDDNGQTWRRSTTVLTPTSTIHGDTVLMQEPGVVELDDNRLLMFIRTDQHVQYISFSADNGETWLPAQPSNISSPRSPASIERIPKTGDLLLVWNNNQEDQRRTPYNVAISRDEGVTWGNIKTLEDDPHGWYCYSAVTFVNNYILLGHCAGDRREGGLNTTQITRFPVSYLYEY